MRGDLEVLEGAAAHAEVRGELGGAPAHLRERVEIRPRIVKFQTADFEIQPQILTSHRRFEIKAQIRREAKDTSRASREESALNARNAQQTAPPGMGQESRRESAPR